MKKFLLTREFHAEMKRVEFHSGMKFNLEENLQLSMKTYNTNIFFLSLLRKEKRDYFENLDTKNISDNKTFWKTIKPLLFDKSRLTVNVH